MKHISVLLLICFFSLQSIAQFTYERNYPPNTRGQIVVDMEPTAGGYYVLSLIRDTTKLDYIYGVNLVEMEIKGGLILSRDYVFSDSLKVLSAGGLTRNKNGSLIFAVDVDTIDQNRILVGVEKGSLGVQWAQKFGTTPRDTALASQIFANDVFMTKDENLLHMTSIVDTLMSSLYISCADTFGIQKWARTYDYVEAEENNYDEEWGGTTAGLFNTTISAGQLLSDTNYVFVSEFSNFGDPLWARKYQFDNNDADGLKVADITMLADSSLMITGTVRDSADITRLNGFVMRVDTLGEYIWSRTLDHTGSLSSSYITSSIAKSDTSILVGLKASEKGSPLLAYIAEIGQSGIIVWQKEYKLSSDSGVYEGALRATEDNGYAYAITGSEDFNSEILYLIKTDENGETRCHEESLVLSLNELYMTADTAVWSTEIITGQDTIMVFESQYDDYAIPSITLDNIVFCPNEVIDTILDVTIPEASAYLWGSDANGETTPIINVTAEGDYTVEVTIDTLYCYTLCDTANISRQALPMASLSVGNEWCENRRFRLFASANNQIISSVWSTGAMNTNNVFVDGPGTYSVTITDNCAETSTATVTINDSDIPQPDQIEIVSSANFECFEPTARLQVVLSQNPNNPEPGFTNIAWSTGEQDVRVIFVAEAGIYTVTLLDDCGYERTASITIGNGDLSAIAMPNIIISNENFCTEGTYTATLENYNIYASAVWNIGGLTITDQSSVPITDIGTYSIRVTDVCGVSMDIEFEVTAADTPDPDALAISQNINFDCFQPSGRLEVSSVSGNPLSNIIWNPGEINGSSILVDVAGDYDVTAIDECGFELTANTNLPNLSNPLALPSLQTSGFNTYCDEGTYQIDLINADNYESIVWSVGELEPETGASVSVSTPGTYEVTVTDDCGATEVASITVTPADFPACPCLEYPNLFMPGSGVSADSLNITFGPHKKCDDSLISDYELVIYNRWGNQVFQTTTLNERWNGNHNDRPAPSEVYLFFARYVTSEETFEVKGDITLLR